VKTESSSSPKQVRGQTWIRHRSTMESERISWFGL